jgi:hypothetical protein
MYLTLLPGECACTAAQFTHPKNTFARKKLAKFGKITFFILKIRERV